MKKIHSFTDELPLSSPYFIFRSGKEVPSQSSDVPEGNKEEPSGPTPEQVEARGQRESEERQDRIFQEIYEKVQLYEDQRFENSELGDIERDLIQEDMKILVQQINEELDLGLNVDTSKYLDMWTLDDWWNSDTINEDIGLFMRVLGEGNTELKVYLRPDGSYETREARSNGVITYFDSRSGRSDEYGPLPIREDGSIVYDENHEILIQDTEALAELERLRKERDGVFNFPSSIE